MEAIGSIYSAFHRYTTTTKGIANSYIKNHPFKKLEGEGRNRCTVGKEESVSLFFQKLR